MNHDCYFGYLIALVKAAGRFYIYDRIFPVISRTHWLQILAIVFLLTGSSFTGCEEGIKNKYNTNNFEPENTWEPSENIIPAAERTAHYYSRIQDKKIGIVVNHTSLVGNVHLLDTLLSLGIDVRAIFTPEHGLQGTADAGEKIDHSVYGTDNIPIISLYGNARKPEPDHLSGLDLMIFDIQDVGVRYYTYIGTLHYIMEACAENNLPLLILDRPNPNGFYVDGPLLDTAFTSFVGMHPVPVVHGLTVGEYAGMINGEGWLKNGVTCELDVILCLNYDHTMTYDLPVKPSPNLPNLRSILLYPSLCLFEGTTLSIGRGTEQQFQVIGHPDIGPTDFSFTPISRPGATNPKHLDKICYGEDLSQIPINHLLQDARVSFEKVIEYYNLFQEKGLTFFPERSSFDRLAGSDKLRKQIIEGLSMEEIRASWEEDLEEFKEKRKKYLLYN